ncbi:MAG: nuclear transport factor 2 family protein [Acetobacteraceae bacterium]
MLLLGVALAVPAVAQTAPQSSNDPAAATAEVAQDYMAMHQLEAVFHKAATDHDMDTLLSLFANNAGLTVEGKTYTGTDQIRNFFQSSGPFTHHWVGYTAAFRIAYKLTGDTGQLHFGCLYVDAKDNKFEAYADFDAAVVRQNGKWLFQDVKVTPAPSHE